MAKMSIKRRESNLLEIELPGEDHSLANLIVRLALDRPEVEYASYSIDHPLIGVPKVVIRTSGNTDPMDVLKKVLADIRDLSREFRNALEEELESTQG